MGRERELAILRARLAALRSDKGGVVFVTGEPGVGKSRILNELTGLARSSATAVLAGRSVPDSSDVAYRPFAEILAQIFRGGPLPEGAEFDAWQPALHAILPTLDVSRPDSGSFGAHMCGEAMIRVLRWASAQRPLVVLLEDLHWADPDTLGVLEYLADNVAQSPVLLIASLRDEPPTQALELVRRTRQRNVADHLQLDRLTDDGVTEIVTACLPEAGADLLDRVLETADGVPLLVEEVLATDGVPASINEAVRTRVAKLDESDRSVLYAAALLGRDFDWELLPIVTGQSADQVAAALERLVAAMLISIDGDGFRFRHALTREGVVAMLVPPRRAALARSALAALDTHRPEHGHAELAMQAGDPQRASALLTAAGQAALDRGAFGTAIQTLQRAVAMSDDQTDGEMALVTALAHAGRLDEALGVGEGLLERLGGDHPMTAAIHLELARAAVAATRWPTAVTQLDAVTSQLAKQPDQELQAHADVLTAAVELANDDVGQARETAQRALDTATQIGMPHVACHALELIGQSHRVYDLAAAQDAFRQAQRIAVDNGLTVWEMRALHELGTIELLDHAGTVSLEAARRTAEKLGAHSTVTVLDLQLLAADHLHFNLDAARTRGRHVVSRSSRLGLGRLQAAASTMDACTCALHGDRAAMTTAAEQALRVAPDDLEIAGEIDAGATGLFELMWGDRETARLALDRGMATLHRLENSAPAPYRGLWALLHIVEDEPEDAGFIEKIRSSGATVMRPNRGYLRYAEAALTRSAASVSAGDAELAHTPVWLHLGRMLVAEAALRRQWGTPRPWLTEARGCFEAHGLDHLARHCARLLGETPRSVPADVTARESEVLQMVAAGLANKQIARRLQLSVRTVEKHVESLLRKCGAHSRAQLIAMMGENT